MVREQHEKYILDIDMGCDCDDIGALSMLHTTEEISETRTAIKDTFVSISLKSRTESLHQ